MLANLSRREQNILTIGSGVIIVMLFFIYFLQPEWEKYSSDKTNLASLLAKVEMLKADKVKQSHQKTESIASLKSQIRSYRRNLPVTRETAGLVFLLDSAAKETGANLIEIQTGDFSENKNIKGTKILPVNLRVTGDYRQVRDFIIKLEDLTRLNHITGASVKVANGIIEGDISTQIYSWGSGDPSLNDTLSIPKSPVMGKPDPYTVNMLSQPINLSGVKASVYAQ